MGSKVDNNFNTVYTSGRRIKRNTMFFSAITFLFSILAKYDRDEGCTGKLAPISPKGPKFVVQTDFLYIDEKLAIN